MSDRFLDAGVPVSVPSPRAPVHDYVVGLAVAVHHRSDDAVVRVVGELDVATAPQLLAGLDEVSTARAAMPAGRTVWCDLSDLTFISASGVMVLETARAGARDRGVVLHLVAGSRLVRRVLSITGSALSIHPGPVPREDPSAAGSGSAQGYGETHTVA